MPKSVASFGPSLPSSSPPLALFSPEPSEAERALMPADSTQEADYTAWFDWLLAQGAYTPLESVVSPPPIVSVPPPIVSPEPPQAPVAPTLRALPQPSYRSTRTSARAAAQQRDYEQMRTGLLCDTRMGRAILDLARYPWHRLPNGLAAMQFAPEESIWRSNDCANNINWLRCGAYAHRNAKLNVIGVHRVETLRPYFAACGVDFFDITPKPESWPVRKPIITYPRMPRFLHDAFISRNAREQSDSPEPQDAGQAARTPYERP